MEITVHTAEETFGEKIEGIKYIDRIGVYEIVVSDEGKIATVKTPTGYFLPGGGIEDGENHSKCLEREFMEETGYEIEVGKYIGKASLFHVSRTNQYLHGIGHFYIVDLKYMTNNKTEDDHELLWLEAKECIKCLFLKHQSWAIEKMLEDMA